MIASISGIKFNDFNFNGVQDGQEPGLENFEIQLLDSSGNVAATTTTDISGFYEFSDLAPGSYIVREVSQTGFVQTQPTFPTEVSEVELGFTDNFQSPVNIANTTPIEFNEILKTSYDGEGAAEIENTGSNFEVIYEEGNNNFININGEEFELVNFHFHAESEHTVDGELSEMEMHIVHRNETGGLAVLGVFIEGSDGDDGDDEDENKNNSLEGDHKYGCGCECCMSIRDLASVLNFDRNDYRDDNDNDDGSEFANELAPVFDTVAEQLEENGSLPNAVEFTEEIDLAELLPDDSGWFYNGSLTTPPFSQEVNWFVFEEPIKLSEGQMNIFQDFLESVDLESNNRDLQPLNGRQFNELNYQVTVGDESITDLNFGDTPVNEIVGDRGIHHERLFLSKLVRVQKTHLLCI